MSSDQSLTHRTLGSLVWVFTGTVAQSSLSLLVLMILARLLSPTEFGIVNAALVVVGISQIFSQLGIGPAIVQRPKLSREHIHTGFALSIMFGVLVALALVLSATLIAQFYRMSELKRVMEVLAFIFPLTGIGSVSRGLLERKMAFKRLAVIQLVSFVIGYGLVGIVLALRGLGVWALVFAQFGQAAIETALLLVSTRDVIGFSLRRKEMGELVNFGTGLSLAQTANYLALQGDNLVVGRWLGATALGVYGRAYHFLVMPANLIGNMADRVLFPAMASVQSDGERLKRAYFRALGIIAMVTLPLSSVLIVLAPEIVYAVLGAQWAEVVPPFRILATALFFRTGYKISDSLVRAKGAVYHSAWRKAIYAVTVIMGAWIGHHWGLTGTAIGVCSAILLQYLLMFHLSSKLLNASWRQLVQVVTRHFVVAFIVACALLLLKMLLPTAEIYDVIVLIAGGVVALLAVAITWIAYHDIFGDEGAWIWMTTSKYVGRLRGKEVIPGKSNNL